jgi:hypothetical protein
LNDCVSERRHCAFFFLQDITWWWPRDNGPGIIWYQVDSKFDVCRFVYIFFWYDLVV